MNIFYLVLFFSIAIPIFVKNKKDRFGKQIEIELPTKEQIKDAIKKNYEGEKKTMEKRLFQGPGRFPELSQAGRGAFAICCLHGLYSCGTYRYMRISF